MEYETCDRCGKRLLATDERLHRVEMTAPPGPECPEGYGCEVTLCHACWLRYAEGLGECDA
jgi:hypothetical protein